MGEPRPEGCNKGGPKLERVLADAKAWQHQDALVTAPAPDETSPSGYSRRVALR
jgi:hypothetical protein